MEPRLRASPEQFSVLLGFMERHGDLSRPQPGLQGRINCDMLWQKLTIKLNSLRGGVKRSSDKWRKVWADWKTKTKKKFLRQKLQASGNDGVPRSTIHLTALEERVVAVIGVSAAVSQRTSIEQVQDVESILVFPLDQDHTLDEDHKQNIKTPASPAISSPPSPPSRVSPLPPQNNRRQSTDSLRSTATARRRILRARRKRGMTPFEWAVDQFAAVERNRLEHEEARDMRLHEREMERIRLEAERMKVTREHNRLLYQLSLLGQQLIDVITQQRPGSSP